MAVNFKKLTFTQLLAIAGGVLLTVMILTGFILSMNKKPPAKVVTQRPTTNFQTSAADVAMDQLRQELKVLQDKVATNERVMQDGFSRAATAIDQQNVNIGTLDTNNKVTANRVTNLERQRIGMRVQVVKPEDQLVRPSRSERISAAQRRDAVNLSSTRGYAVQAAVGNRAWVRTGGEEFSVREGEPLPVTGPLVVKSITPSGTVSVGVDTPK